MLQPRSQFINVDGVNLHVADWGGAGPDLLLLHAGGFLGYVYRAMILKFRAGYRVWTMDLRGQGDSDKPPPQYYRWEYMFRDVEGVIDHLGLSHFYGLGHSGGGAVMALYAARYPERVKGLALIEPVIIPPEPRYDYLDGDSHPFVERARRRRVVWGSRQELFASYRTKEAFASWKEEVLWDYVNHGSYELPDGRVALKCPAEVEAQLFANSRSLDIFSEIPQVKCPVLVLRGEKTGEPLYLVSEKVAAQLPRGQLITVPDTGHFLPMEKPVEVAEIILRFFRESG